MKPCAYTLFETAIGPCALAWNENGIAGVQLPEADAAATRRRMLERFHDARETAPSPAVAAARDGLVALLEGKSADLSRVGLDLRSVPPFHRRVYEAARAIAPGRTLTYGALARIIGADGAARAVGQALGRNPFPLLVPCHRVLAANGGLGGFSAHGGVETKRRLLDIEAAGRAWASPSMVSRRASSPRRRKQKEKRHEGVTAGLQPHR